MLGAHRLVLIRERERERERVRERESEREIGTEQKRYCTE